MCCPSLPVHDESPMCNTERVIRNTKRDLRSLEVSLGRHHSSDQHRSAIKSQQRSLRRLMNVALQQQVARTHARKDRQRCARSKWQHAHCRGTGKDVPIPSWSGSVDKLVIEYLADYCPYNEDCCASLVYDDEDCGAGIQPGRGWRVVAISILQNELSHSYYLAANPATSQAILSPFRVPYHKRILVADFDEDGIYTVYAAVGISIERLVMEGLDDALRIALSPRRCTPAIEGALSLSCADLLRYARSRLDPVSPSQPLQQRATYMDQMQKCSCNYRACRACASSSRNEAILALYATFLWSCPLVLSAGQFVPWQVRVWTPWRFRALVRLQARVHGWSVRRSLYSPHTELGKRRLLRLWASFQHDC